MARAERALVRADRCLAAGSFVKKGAQRSLYRAFSGRSAGDPSEQGVEAGASRSPDATRLLLFQGVALALFLQGFIYIGVPFGLAFACFAGIARSRSSKDAPEEVAK